MCTSCSATLELHYKESGIRSCRHTCSIVSLIFCFLFSFFFFFCSQSIQLQYPNICLTIRSLYVFRKKLSNYAGAENWNHTHNFVAKQYMEEVERDVYFQDVKLQMDAKLWGEEYSRHNPPKKVNT